MSRILIVDDATLFQHLLSKLLTSHGYETVQAKSGEEALEVLRSQTFDLMISDISMRPIDGMELLHKVRESFSTMSVIMLTAHESINTAVDSMKTGAFDYLTKPFKINELLQTVRHALEHQISHTENIDLQAQLEYRDHVEKLKGIVTENPGMLQMCNRIERIAPSDSPVLIYGEKGSGKKLVARDLHRYSPRRQKPFTVVNCAALPDSLMESEPGGPAGGTFGTAHGGTLFLAEINALPLDFQARLIDLLQIDTITTPNGSHQTKIDIRIIAASTEKLEPLIEQGRFREDLYQQLSGFTIDIPPLRNRPEDIIPLVGQTLHRKLDADARMPMLNHETELILDHYTWPGNVRELEECILHALASMQNGMITPDDLPAKIVAAVADDLRSGVINNRCEQFVGRSLKAFLRKKETELLGRVSNSLEEEREVEEKPSAKATGAAHAKPDATDIWGIFEGR